MDTEYKETSAALGLDGSAPETATDAGAAEAAPEVSKKTPPVWKWLAPVLLVLAAAAVIFLLIGRKSADDYIAELNYDNGGLVTYDNQYVYYLAPYHINSEDKRIVVYEVDPSGDESRVICKENTIKAIRSAGSELYCLGAKGSKGAPYLAHIDKTSGELTVLRRFPAETRISYFLVRNSDLFYCADGTLYNIVGFQTHLTWGEQKRVFSMIPALKNAEFVRYGVMHRNTYLNSPKLLDRYYRLKTDPRLSFAGQMTGVEGYVESAASGMLAGIETAARILGLDPVDFPQETAIGALSLYISGGSVGDFQPMNVNFGIISPLGYRVKGKRNKNAEISARSLAVIEELMKKEVFGFENNN